jgi:hypothetical protein
LRLIDAWHETGASTPVELCMDFDDPCLQQVEEMRLPQGWHIEIGHRGPLSAIYNAAYERNRDAPFFGFIADDVVPITNGWDIKLIDVAGSDGMAVPAGGETTGGCPHFVIGGDLVRSMGWLALPGLDRLFIDTVWGEISDKRDVLRRVPDVTLEHRHFSNGKAMMDDTYRKHKKAQDKLIYNNWRHQHAYLS